MITCYPIPVLNRLAWPTFKQLLSFRKLGFVVYNILNIKMLYSMFTLKEGEDDEFHIGTIALLPESRGLGIGTRLIEFAEEQASLQGFAKCSLTVKKENQLAIKLYQRIGYQITGEINKPKLSLYRMVKNVEPTTIYKNLYSIRGYQHMPISLRIQNYPKVKMYILQFNTKF